MNGGDLLKLVVRAQEINDKSGAQSALEKLATAAQNLANDPQNQEYQTTFSDAFKQLKAAFSLIDTLLSPSDRERLNEISMNWDFSFELVDQIENSISENPASLAVVRDEVEKIREKREQELGRFDQLAADLIHFGFEEHTHAPDRAELGFRIPRDIFDNEFGGLISELQFLRRLMRLVGEAAGEEDLDFEIQSISTTDPFFWLLVSYGVAMSFGKLTTWGLDTWKKVEDIRQVRAQTSKLDSFTEKEVERIFGSKIQKQIDDAVDEKAKELAKGTTPAPRRNELENGLRALIPHFLARLERGLSVDVRYLPPPQPENENDEGDERGENSQTTEVSQRQAEIAGLASGLQQIEINDTPILKIEAANENNEN